MTDFVRSMDEQVNTVTERLVEEYDGRVPAPVVRDLVTQEYGALRQARVTQFVPVLVDRSVRRRLRVSGG